MYIYDIDYESHIYGPGKRIVIWTQGCSLHCDGCWNHALWPFTKGKMLDIPSILKAFQTDSSIKGITILGGEPLDQWSDLKLLIENVKSYHKTVILYTGYELEEIQPLRLNWIKNHVDIFIPGRYVHALRDTGLYLRGSANQKLYFYSNIYTEAIIKEGTYVQIELDLDGSMTLSGYPEDFLKEVS